MKFWLPFLICCFVVLATAGWGVLLFWIVTGLIMGGIQYRKNKKILDRLKERDSNNDIGNK